MSRHKIHPDMPSGLTQKERREWFKANGICCRCFQYIEIDCQSRTFCESCLIQERTVKREQFRKRNQKLKHDNLDFCVERATKLKISYGEYMALKSRGSV